MLQQDSYQISSKQVLKSSIALNRYTAGGIKDLDEGKANIKDEAYTKAVDTLEDLVKAGLFKSDATSTNYDKASQQFLNGDAATVDGANNIIAHTQITIPLLAETYKFCLIISFTGGIKAFTEMFIMTKGGPGTSTYTLTFMMHNSSIRVQQYGYGMAFAAIMVLECMTLMIMLNVLFRERDAYGKKKKGNRRLRNAA